MKLTQIKPLNEAASAITISKVADDLFHAIKHADGMNPDHVDIKLSKDAKNKLSILVKDWGNTQDTGADDYDEHKQQIQNEKELTGIVNKFQSAHSDIVFKIEFFEEGNFAHIEISAATPIVTTESENKEATIPEKVLATAIEKAIDAFKKVTKHNHHDTVYKSVRKNKDGNLFAIVWNWGSWNEAHDERRSGPSHPTYLSQQDAERIVRELNKELKPAGVEVKVEFDNDESLTLTSKPTGSKERPDTDFI